jgi:hypothetical protein
MFKSFLLTIDSIAAYNLNTKHSTKDHFFYNPDLLDLKWTINKNIPKIKNICSNDIDKYLQERFEYQSAIDNSSCNNKVIVNYKKALPTNDNIIFIHGWKSSSFRKLDSIFLNPFIEKQLNLYYFTLPFHMDRSGPKDGYNGECFLSSNINRTITSVIQSISDLTALISYIKSISTGKIIIIGLSLGGMVSNMLSALDNRVDYLISLFYANSLAYTTFHSLCCLNIKSDLVKNNLNEVQLTKYWNFINPSTYKPKVKNILLISGRYDRFVYIHDTDWLWLNWDKPNRIVYDCGHAGIVLCKKKIQSDVLKFLWSK